MERSEAIRQADEARNVLEHPLVQSALSAMREGLSAQLWDTVKSGGDVTKLAGLVWALEQFEACFTVLIEGGELAKAELTLEANAKAKAKQALERIRA